ncbi:hypothetical protein NADFUDRAFT_62365 [Nadsonia fulvescens var. elongata DSM 6958]|uniref:Pre-mRNA-processing protein 45 n=1 Tax=Nadsonia fulvescens var. elongata DSM 6958 TaxID=857566 RepID=A0A1E3PED9_9ASCO|nr:hypothetical protein NADFUDRAFT_62365 [Nadsonia fulvescens var. elongata DSM 6958]
MASGSHDIALVTSSDTGTPAYGHRAGWSPQTLEDFGDGGAFPEIHIAQYPLKMGLKTSSVNRKSNALSLRVGKDGQAKYDDIARLGHSKERVIQSTYTDMIPLRQRVNVGELSLERPSEDVVKETKDRTASAIADILNNKLNAGKPKTKTNRDEPTYIRYTPSSIMGEAANSQKIIKIVDLPADPLAPFKFKATKVPGRPPSPPPPILRSPPRKLTAQDQEDWYIPPAVSNWKNPKGFTIDIDKRLVAAGRGLEDNQINDNFAKVSEALYVADKEAREHISQRAEMRKQLAEKENALREEKLRQLAQQARQERSSSPSFSPPRNPRDRARSRTLSPRSDNEDSIVRERKRARYEKVKEAEKELRMSKMGRGRRVNEMARDQNRDISERVALGVAKPSKLSGEAQFDSRLFGNAASSANNFNEDQFYDKPLFAAQEVLNNIYRPTASNDPDGEKEDIINRFSAEKRFDSLGKATHGFEGADTVQPREGPVIFEKDNSDNILPVEVQDNETYGLSKK